ncbi:DUF4292 domain-containing protein [Flavihumibacter profundi]|uniref:DUF4292 domain-containing protein n=1 Tax=Flavihumibacter profundi TaxID=2716883 RepID=UPI001CC43CC6|nr:DUF4292 domain-containing protein [Flavihumibacter profundi]MBZ5858435.1 DUF4292 domain-containing protein [Flavihumibacter profundi]
MKQVIYVLVIIAALVTTGCHTTKKINAVITRKDSTETVLVDPHIDSVQYINNLMSAIGKNRIDYKTFSAKIKVDYWDKDGKGPDLTIFVRMQKDSVIWLSINATVFSYEAFRVIITPDSVKLLNKKDKILQLRSSNYLVEVAHLPFDFAGLQDLIIGNPVFLDSNIVSYKKEPDVTSLLCIGEIFKNLLTIDNGDFLVRHSKLDDVNPIRNRTADLSYANYDGAGGKAFSTSRSIILTEKNRFEVQLDFKQFAFNETLNFPFPIPKNYTVQ